jgi:hypothetical protein
MSLASECAQDFDAPPVRGEGLIFSRWFRTTMAKCGSSVRNSSNGEPLTVSLISQLLGLGFTSCRHS